MIFQKEYLGCVEAHNNPEKHYILIIDDINRGQISRIFGDIIYCLEYRGKEVELPYSKALFKIPEKLILIGTMNSTDRPIAFFDYTLRRRFAFYEFFSSGKHTQDEACHLSKRHIIVE